MTPIPKPPRRGPKPRKRISRRRKSVFAQTIKVLDQACADAVRTRDGHRCTLCGAPELGRKHDWAHLLSRRYLSTRWDWKNSTTLCRRCHQKYTRRPDEWFDLCQARLGPEAWEALKLQAMWKPAGRAKHDLQAWLICVQMGPQGEKPW